ncbi:MAG: hemolysin family protein [Planctomycetota bacterium]
MPVPIDGFSLFGVGLLMLSALFSSSETAFFSLAGEALEGRVDRRVQRLLREPRELLVSLLAGNLFVNVLFFAIAARSLPLAGFWSGLLALVTILIVGEILPKALALRMPHRIASLSAPFWLPYMHVAAPVRRWVAAALDGALRMLGEHDRREVGLTAETLAGALEASAAEGSLAHAEADLLTEIVQISNLRVREIMTPRVDVLALDLEDPEEHETIIEQARRARVTWLPVVRGDMDSVEGAVEMRDLFAHEGKPLEQLVMPVQFVPEVAPVLNMLSYLRDARAAEAVVVDEWGGTAGVVSLENLFEELVGDLRAEGEGLWRAVIPMGEGRYRVTGEISIRDWNETMGVQVVPAAFETLGGYVLALLGRLPKPGDRVELGANLVGEVSEVRGRRVVTVDLFLKND